MLDVAEHTLIELTGVMCWLPMLLASHMLAVTCLSELAAHLGSNHFRIFSSS